MSGPGGAGGLPSWPFTAAFVGLPLWWMLGVIDFIWIPMAVLMGLYMIRTRTVRSPRIFAVWLLFLVWAACSVIGLSAAGELLVFGYRYAIYAACTVLFLYVYNGRRNLTDRFVTGVLTAWWGMAVAGGYLAMLFPTGIFRTPLSFILPRGLVENPWLNQMIVRRLNQYNPDGYFGLDPRPSAPFLYTNNWGNIYSLLLPVVLVYLWQVRGTRRFWVVAAAIPVSLVPAILTTNRGMFLGLGIAAVYAALRMALRRDVRGIVALVLVSTIAVGAFQVLPAADRLETRTEATSTQDRASLYSQAIDAVQLSPLFGYGGPIAGDADNVDPVGTQGQFWMVLVSHGIGGAVLFMGWFVLAFLLSLRRADPVGLAANTLLLVAIFEFGYYGVLPYGLPVIMIAAALALRPRPPARRQPGPRDAVALQVVPRTASGSRARSLGAARGGRFR